MEFILLIYIKVCFLHYYRQGQFHCWPISLSTHTRHKKHFGSCQKMFHSETSVALKFCIHHIMEPSLRRVSYQEISKVGISLVCTNHKDCTISKTM